MIRHAVSSPINTAALAGVCLTALYTLFISGADAITKIFAESYPPPQLFALSGLLVAAFCVMADRRPHSPSSSRQVGFTTQCPWAMIVRSVATVLGTLAFFYAFHLLPFAEVFVFIALIPLMAALASGPVLGEGVSWRAWVALLLGSLGLASLFPSGIDAIGWGHMAAFVAALMGTTSMVASRYIGQRENKLLAQVFYPNLLLGIVMVLALPFVFRPMSVEHVMWAVIYAALLFGARWVLVGALKLLPAYVVTPLINLQFVWMVALGIAVFGERPSAEVYLGASLTILAGIWLVYDQVRGQKLSKPLPTTSKQQVSSQTQPAVVPAE
ncbi:MAG: DMT family transporter [Pseudomonadota bacterium]